MQKWLAERKWEEDAEEHTFTQVSFPVSSGTARGRPRTRTLKFSPLPWPPGAASLRSVS